MKRGFVVCFEGIDGAGKRTQAALLMKGLGKSGIKAKVYSYPDYGSDYGKIIDRYLHGAIELGRREHFLLFLIDILKDQDRLREDLKNGTIVIMDRYFYTALAYICPSGLDYDRAKKFVELIDFDYPSMVFYLDMPTALTAKRKKNKLGGLDKFEKNQKFLKEVKKVYENMLEERYGCRRWIRIDATMPAGAVHKEVLKRLG